MRRTISCLAAVAAFTVAAATADENAGRAGDGLRSQAESNTTAAASQAAPASGQSIVASLIRQIHHCWNPPVQIVGSSLRVTVHFRLKRDGTLADKPTVVRPGDGALFQAAAESALRAVRACAPFRLPVAQYELWSEVEAVFDPSTMSGAGPSGARR